MAADLANDKFWVNKSMYHEADKLYHEGLAKGGVGTTNVSKDPCIKSSLSMEVAKARELIKTSMQRVDGITALAPNDKSSTCNMNNTDLSRLTSVMERLENCLKNLEKRVELLEIKCNANIAVCPAKPAETRSTRKVKGDDDDDDDVDLFGSDSDEESEEAKKIREQRLAEYAAKKSKKPTLIAKSNIILDINPWNELTDMKKLEEAVRNVKMHGLVWGASKLVPLAFGINKLQISCVVEDEKVSVIDLIDTLDGIERYVQSIDVVASNKV